MRFSDIPFRPSKKTLRQFSGLWVVLFAVIGLRIWFTDQRSPLKLQLTTLALIVGLTGLLRPQLIRPLFVGWMVLVFPLGWMMSQLVLGILYYGLFAPIAVVLRLAGRDALWLKRPTGRTTYFVPKDSPGGLRRYFRQF